MYCNFRKFEDGRCYCINCDSGRKNPELDCDKKLILRECKATSVMSETVKLKLKELGELKEKANEDENYKTPNFFEKVMNYGEAIKKHVFSGMKTRSQEEINRIFKICEKCEFFQNNSCRICGCAISNNPNAFRNKVAMASEHCPIGKWKFEGIIQENRLIEISLERLVRDTIYALNAIPVNEIDCVVGVGRSGVIPATTLACCLNTRLFAVFSSKKENRNQLVEIPCGYRMSSKNFNNEDFNAVLVIDDSAVSGGSLLESTSYVKSVFSNKKVYSCAIYNHTSALKSEIDFPIVHLPLPHIFEWNIMNSVYVPEMGIDLDGVLCNDYPPDLPMNDENHLEFIKNSKPKQFLPRREAVAFIATGRPEKFRKETEDWLKINKIKYNNLYMYPGSIEERDRNFFSNVVSFKESIIKKHRPKFFVESDYHQAIELQKRCVSINCRVICFNKKTG